MDHRQICNPKLARAFFVIQRLGDMFPPMEGLCKGTIFPELYCPYEPKHHQHDYDRREGRNRNCVLKEDSC
ncbi:spore coat associated protein CotJA [Syntrophomonas curvata]